MISSVGWSRPRLPLSCTPGVLCHSEMHASRKRWVVCFSLQLEYRFGKLYLLLLKLRSIRYSSQSVLQIYLWSASSLERVFIHFSNCFAYIKQGHFSHYQVWSTFCHLCTFWFPKWHLRSILIVKQLMFSHAPPPQPKIKYYPRNLPVNDVGGDKIH